MLGYGIVMEFKLKTLLPRVLGTSQMPGFFLPELHRFCLKLINAPHMHDLFVFFQNYMDFSKIKKKSLYMSDSSLYFLRIRWIFLKLKNALALLLLNLSHTCICGILVQGTPE